MSDKPKEGSISKRGNGSLKEELLTGQINEDENMSITFSDTKVIFDRSNYSFFFN